MGAAATLVALAVLVVLWRDDSRLPSSEARALRNSRLTAAIIFLLAAFFCVRPILGV